MRQKIYLVDDASGAPIECELLTGENEYVAELWEQTWQPIMLTLPQQLIKRKVPQHLWPQDIKWDWANKLKSTKGILAYPSVSIICQNRLEGVMLLNTASKRCQLPSQKGEEIVYVELISTAPWNRIDISDPILHRGAGSILLRCAVLESIALQYKGRVGLSALPQAEPFYRKIGMTEMARDTSTGMVYFEMTPEVSKKFLAIGEPQNNKKNV